MLLQRLKNLSNLASSLNTKILLFLNFEFLILNAYASPLIIYNCPQPRANLGITFKPCNTVPSIQNSTSRIFQILITREVYNFQSITQPSRYSNSQASAVSQLEVRVNPSGIYPNF